MNFKLTQIAALTALALASAGAHAALSSNATLSIEGDAVTAFGDPNSTDSLTTSVWHVSSNGSALDSFFTMGGAKTPQLLNTQFAYLYGGSINLGAASQEDITTWTYYGAAGNNDLLTGASVISASGDTAIINLSGWVVDWTTAIDVNMGSNAWSNYSAGVPYVNGQAFLKCDAGSGCAAGSAYTLKYTATVPTTSKDFPGVQYYLELHGTVGAVPEASTYGMMLAGLGLVGFAVRRRKQVI